MTCYSHTRLGLDLQIGRHLSSIVVPLVYVYLFYDQIIKLSKYQFVINVYIVYNVRTMVLHSGGREYESSDDHDEVLLLLDFSQAFDMVVHGMLLCKLQNAQNYSVGAGMLVGSYLGERAQFVRSDGQDFSVETVTCGVPQGFCSWSALVYIIY
jgi:hypothetical protein